MNQDSVSFKAFIRNTLNFKVYVDSALIQEVSTDEAVVQFLHKSKFRNKLRVLKFSTEGIQDPIVNGIPGILNKEVLESYVVYTCEIPANLQGLDWLGRWDILISLGTVDDIKLTVNVKDYITFVEPVLNIEEYVRAIGCSVTKLGQSIIIGRLFKADSSDLDGPDVLASEDILV